ncbi:hypothetical protein FPQ18DRAFT_393600 [Pyronema domesticum]|nr:hypothetical protein FPQ18DRAFT_393600 [Pyronema domesticum]
MNPHLLLLLPFAIAIPLPDNDPNNPIPQYSATDAPRIKICPSDSNSCQEQPSTLGWRSCWRLLNPETTAGTYTVTNGCCQFFTNSYCTGGSHFTAVDGTGNGWNNGRIGSVRCDKTCDGIPMLMEDNHDFSLAIDYRQKSQKRSRVKQGGGSGGGV